MKNKTIYLMNFFINGSSVIIKKNKVLKCVLFFFFNDFLINLKLNNFKFIKIILNNSISNLCLISFKKNAFTYVQHLFYKVFKESCRGFYVNLEIRGRNYKFFFESGYLIIFLGFSHYIYVPVPQNILIISLFNKNTQLILYSVKKEILFNFKYFLQKLYKKDFYKGKGIFFSIERPLLKEGKKKEFF